MKKAIFLSAIFFLVSVLQGSLIPSFAEIDDDGSEEKTNIALLRMEVPSGFYREERMALASDFLNALQETGAFNIVSRDDMDEIVRELKFQASDLVDEDEVVELGGLLGVDRFVTYSVRPVQGIYQVTVRMIDVEKGKVDKIVVKRCEDKFDYLPALCNEIAYDLAGMEDQKGRVRVQTDPQEAEVFVFGISKGYSPISFNLAPGVYMMQVKKPGYEERKKTLVVAHGQEHAWKTNLVKKKRSRLRDYIGGKSFWSK